MNQTTDVVIVGGGVAGCATAYYLAQAGVKVTVVESQGIGMQASGYSAGGLNPLQGAQIPGPLGALAMESFRLHLGLWERLREDTGIDCQGRSISLVKVALDEAELPELQETVDLFAAARGDGFSARWLDSKEAAELEPRLAQGVLRGVQAQGNAALDSYLLTLALARAAERLGASFRTGRVQGLQGGPGLATAVALADGAMACGQVVLAMGPWSREAEAWLGVSIPVEPLKGEILRLRLSLDGPALAHDFSGGGSSLHPKPDGLVWVGATEERRGFDKQPSAEARESIWGAAKRLMPSVAQARLVNHTACLRPVTPDWLPIVGQAPGWDNVYLCTGAGKKGVLLAPGMGRAVAELATQGRTGISIGPCAPERFGLVARA